MGAAKLRRAPFQHAVSAHGQIPARALVGSEKQRDISVWRS